jgi:hypothetical protein
MSLQSTSCYLSLCNNWHLSLLALSPVLMQNWVLQSRWHRWMLRSCVFTTKLYILHSTPIQSCQLPTNPTSCCFLFKSHFVSQLVLFFKLFFAVYLWLWTSLLRFWCNVANPPQLQACLKITAFHQVRFWVRKLDVALSGCSCQDRILLMYAVITWILVLGTRNSDTCQHYKDRHLEKPMYLWGLIKKFLACARSQHIKSCDSHVMNVHHLLLCMNCTAVCKSPQVLLLHTVTWFKDSPQWRLLFKMSLTEKVTTSTTSFYSNYGKQKKNILKKIKFGRNTLVSLTWKCLYACGAVYPKFLENNRTPVVPKPPYNLISHLWFHNHHTTWPLSSGSTATLWPWLSFQWFQV